MITMNRPFIRAAITATRQGEFIQPVIALGAKTVINSNVYNRIQDASDRLNASRIDRLQPSK